MLQKHYFYIQLQITMLQIRTPACFPLRWACLLKQQSSIAVFIVCQPRKANVRFRFHFRFQKTNGSRCFPLVPLNDQRRLLNLCCFYVNPLKSPKSRDPISLTNFYCQKNRSGLRSSKNKLKFGEF
jgi:hypothetical protein